MSRHETTETRVSAPPGNGSGPPAPQLELPRAPERLEAARRRPPRGRARRMRRLWAALRRVPSAAWLCALVAVVNAAAWSVIMPPFQAPDEPSHFAYVEHLAETGELPSSSGEAFPPAEEVALADVLQAQVRFSQENHTISSEAQQRRLEFDLALPFARNEPGDAGLAASQPPLYYALETIPYYAGLGGTLLDRLALMRLLSAAMGGLTALFCFLFLREALPGARWAWTVGGLGVALAPLLGMMSGSVNPDALLFAVSAALFYCVARGFRRGLTRRLAIAIGAAIALGCLSKLTFIGLVPGALLGLLALAVREARAGRRGAYGSAALGVALPAIVLGAYLTLEALSKTHETTAVFSGAATLAGRHRSVLGAVSDIWQLYLPRLPGMTPTFHGIWSATALWYEQIVGRYGWLDTTFPAWVLTVALIPVLSIAGLFLRALLVGRHALRARWLEAIVYMAMGFGILTLIGLDEYIHGTPGEYLQLRYVLPLIALLGVVLALAARGAGRRWGPVVGTLIVTVILAHDLFSQLLVISRYYG
jgi:hypothetical protein